MSTRMDSSLNIESDFDFVVHNYSLFRQTQNSELLTLGHGLICTASTRAEGWINVGGAPSKLPESTNIFQYNQTLDISIDQKNPGLQVTGVKEWGTPVQNDEDIFTLNDLDDFVSTNLAYLRVKSGFESQIADDHRFNIDLGTLYKVIPQPHIHPSLHHTSSKPIKVPPYKRHKPTPIAPHTLPLPPTSPYARSAWIIPIRGSLPWDGCTSAVILERSHKLPSPSQGVDEPITWTHASLSSFWAFLLNLRTTNNVGSIGLSFHTSHPQLSQSNSLYTTTSLVSESKNRGVYESYEMRNLRSTVSPGPPRPPLSNTDYIKVYHEAPIAMQVRNALHVWAYQSDSSMKTGIPHEKIRLLKGARLVLVDERSKGILIS